MIAQSVRQSLREQGFGWDFSDKFGFLSHFWYAA